MAEYSGRDKRLQYLFEAVENVQVDDMTGASASTDGAHGLVPAPLAGDEDKYLKGDGTWAAVQAGAGALSGLSDVDLATPTDGQALVYDGANSKWVNGNVSGGGNTLVIQDASIYSTDEQQIGVWIDGKPLYQKTIEIASLPQNSSFQSFAHNITSIDTVAYSDVICKQSDGDVWYPIPTARNSSNMLVLSVNKTTVDILNNWYPMINVRATIRYTKTTDAAGSGGYKAYGLSPIIYSTEEREVGVWTDGKPLYQKTIVYTPSGSLSSDVIIDTISNLEVAMVADVFAYKSADNRGVFFPNFDGNARNFLFAWNSNGQITFAVRNDSWDSTWTFYVTIRYTKTIDTAGSGTWTTKGEYAHHYSTTEQVVGTWVDGSTLYEKTLILTSITFGSYINIEYDANAIEGIAVRGGIRRFRASDSANLFDPFEFASGASVAIRNKSVEYYVPSVYQSNFRQLEIIVLYTK